MNKSKRASNKSFAPELPGKKTLRCFANNEELPAINALSIGSAVFQLEQATRGSRLSCAVLPIVSRPGLTYDLDKLAQLIQELLIFTLAEDIRITFRRFSPPDVKNTLPTPFGETDSLCLFSGGTDSYAGILLAKRQLRTVQGVFCAHTDQARIIHIVHRLERKVLLPAGIQVHKQLVPAIESRGYAQLRGFLYLLSAAGWLHKLGSNRLIVTECGPTMYQPRFSALDAVTMTTHPRVVHLAKSVISVLLGREVVVATPFENLTKAEVIAITPSKSDLRLTHSCITQRFGNHDGTCYGCVLRRLATIAVGVDDVRYLNNPIARHDAHSGNLLTLLRFCSDLLTRYGQMEEYEVGMIKYYGKRDLFNRFALDNFAAIHRLISDRRLVQRGVRQLYENVVGVIGTRVLDERLRALRSIKAPTI